MKKSTLILSLCLVAIKLFAQEHNGHKYVDMGGSVYWSPVNMGATIPEGSGIVYAWGETVTKSPGCYTDKDYRHQYPGYIDSDGFDRPGGYTDIGKNISGTKYDAAHVHWGGKWRMPTQEEVVELNKNCTCLWIYKNGVPGVKITSKITGNWLFIPKAKCYEHGPSDSGAWFWTSISDGGYAYIGKSYGDSGIFANERKPKYQGLPIRPVFTKQ